MAILQRVVQTLRPRGVASHRAVAVVSKCSHERPRVQDAGAWMGLWGLVLGPTRASAVGLSRVAQTCQRDKLGYDFYAHVSGAYEATGLGASCCRKRRGPSGGLDHGKRRRGARPARL